MGILNPAGKPARWRAWLVSFSLLAAAAAPSGLWAQAGVRLSLPEIRQVQKVRASRQGGEAAAQAGAARAYLKLFPNGRYADEVLLALGEAHGRLAAPKEALAAYGRLIENFPDSPFREQAMAGSIPLLEQTSQAEQAGAMSAALLKRYPRSLYRGGTLLWQAGVKYQGKAFKTAISLLERIEPDSLSVAERTEYYRLAGWCYRKLKQPDKSWAMFARYLNREDTTERKAPVLMMMAQALEEGGKPGEALPLYAQIVERHPHPEYLAQALFRRAELFASTVLKAAEPPQKEAQREQAIGHYSAYLDSAHEGHRAQALRARASLLKGAGRKEEALRDYQRLAEMGRNGRPEPELLAEMVALLGEVGRGEEGIALLTRAIENVAIPQHERTALVVERAALHYRMGECGRVVAGLQPLPVFRDAERRRRAFFLRGFCRYRLGQWEKASWDLEGLVDEPEYVELVWEPLVDSYERSGQYSRLANLGERMLDSQQVEPTEALLRSMAAAYEKLGEPDRMLSTIKRLEAVNPEALRGADIQFRLGRAEEALGRQEQAETHYLAALEDGAKGEGEPPPAYLGALEQMQGIHLNRGEYEKLAELNERAAKRAGAGAHARRIATLQAIATLRWSQARESEGHPEQARELVELAWAKVPPDFSSQRMEILNAVGNSYTKKKQYAKAERLYARELKQAAGGTHKAKVAAAFGALYLKWAGETEKTDPPAQVTARYEKAMGLLPPEDWQDRYRVATRLDAAYQKTGNHKARARLFARLAPTVPEPALGERLRIYRARIYRDWGRQSAGKGKLKAAEALVAKGEELLQEAEWRPRYELLAVRGEILIGRKDYSDLLIRYEKFLPLIADPALTEQVNHFVGQVYLTWAQAAKKQGNVKSTRIRSHKALDHLPESDWERRVAAANLLNEALDKEDRSAEAAEIYAKLIPTLPDTPARRRYALFLGRKYLKQLKKPGAAQEWLRQGDGGGNDALSLEAAYLLADIEAGRKERDAAIGRLAELTRRGLTHSRWLVPIHSRLAVLYHEKKAFKLALANYRVVAGVKSKELRRLYPRTIDNAKTQARAIRSYLKFRGGTAGGDLAVPKVKR